MKQFLTRDDNDSVQMWIDLIAGWIFSIVCMMLLIWIAVLLVGCKTPEKTSEVYTAPTVITDMAEVSQCAKYKFKNRSVAPKGYIKGMSLAYAQVLCEKSGEPLTTASQRAVAGNTRDALSHYGIYTDTPLRDTYNLLIGLGMRESSGKHCEGRDMSASNVSADTAEAGLFQSSYNIRVGLINGKYIVDKRLDGLYQDYKLKLGKDKCLLHVFKEGVTCSDSNWFDYGTGEGKTFQKLNKNCPAFSVSTAAVAVRMRMSHYGPLKRKEAELVPACEEMLIKVEEIIKDHPEICREI